MVRMIEIFTVCVLLIQYPMWLSKHLGCELMTADFNLLLIPGPVCLSLSWLLRNKCGCLAVVYHSNTCSWLSTRVASRKGHLCFLTPVMKSFFCSDSTAVTQHLAGVFWVWKYSGNCPFFQHSFWIWIQCLCWCHLLVLKRNIFCITL